MNFAQVKGITIPQGAVKQLSQGQTTLWKKRGGVLPADYLELIGISYDGDFHYETGEKLYGSDVITITLDSTSTTGQNVFGSYNGTASGRKNFSLFIYGNGSSSNSYLRYGETLYRPKYGTGKRTLVFGGNGTTDGFATDVAITPDTFVTDVQAFIGWLPNSTSPHYTGDIVGRITAGNRLIWIPVERISDGEIGYYELNSGVFLTKTGTGTPVSLGYLNAPFDAEVEWLEGTGTQYIDTGVSFRQIVSSRYVMQFSSVPSGTGVVFGAYYDNAQVPRGQQYYSGGLWKDATNRYCNSTGISNNQALAALTDYDITTTNIATQASDATLYIFARHNDHGDYIPAVNMRLKSLEMVAGGQILRKFIPVRVGQTGYLWDKVSGDLFGNIGTGDFLLGADK